MLSCNQKSRLGSEKKTESKVQSIISDTLTAHLDEISKLGFINGFSVAIVSENETLYQNGFGYSNIENSIECKDDLIVLLLENRMFMTIDRLLNICKG